MVHKTIRGRDAIYIIFIVQFEIITRRKCFFFFFSSQKVTPIKNSHFSSVLFYTSISMSLNYKVVFSKLNHSFTEQYCTTSFGEGLSIERKKKGTYLDS